MPFHNPAEVAAAQNELESLLGLPAGAERDARIAAWAVAYGLAACDSCQTLLADLRRESGRRVRLEGVVNGLRGRLQQAGLDAGPPLEEIP